MIADPALQFSPLLGYALRVEIPEGTNTGMSVGYEFADKLGYEHDQIYFRYYIRIAADWLTLDGGKFPGIAGTYGVAGWGGRPRNVANLTIARTWERCVPGFRRRMFISSIMRCRKGLMVPVG